MSDLISKKAVIAKSHDIVLGEYRHRCVDAGVIMLMPEVDAIPVEWLKARYKIEGYYGTDAYFRKAYAVKEIIADWEAEQRKEA